MSSPPPESEPDVAGMRFLTDRMRSIDGVVVRRVNGRVQRELGTPRLSAAHGRLMAELRPGSRAIELSRRLGISKAAVGQLLALLEEEQMIQRIPDPADGRAQLIYPTPGAAAAYAVARAGLEEVEAEWRELLGPRRFRELSRALEILDSWRVAAADCG